MDQQIESPIPIIHKEIPQLGFQSFSSSPRFPSTPSDPDQTALDDDNHLHQELQNQLDLKEGSLNSNDSHEEEEEEEEEFKSDKKIEFFYESIEKVGDGGDDLENKNERSNDIENNNSSGYHQYPVRPEAEDCAFYMKTGTCKFGANCKFNHPLRRKNQVQLVLFLELLSDLCFYVCIFCGFCAVGVNVVFLDKGDCGFVLWLFSVYF
jgi:hypothetical protein